MSFSKAKIRRFNDTTGCGTLVGVSANNHKKSRKVKKVSNVLTLASKDIKYKEENDPALMTLPVIFTSIVNTSNTVNFLRKGTVATTATCHSTTKRRASRLPLISRSNSSTSTSMHLHHHSQDHAPILAAINQIHYKHENSSKVEDKDESETPNKILCQHLNQDHFDGNELYKELHMQNANFQQVQNNLKIVNLQEEIQGLKSLKQVEAVENSFGDLFDFKSEKQVEEQGKYDLSEQNSEECKKTDYREKNNIDAALNKPNEELWKQQLALVLESNDKLHKQLEKVRADMNSVKIQSDADKQRCHELQNTLESERKNLIELQYKLRRTEVQLKASQASLVSCQMELNEEKHSREGTIQELNELKAENLILEMQTEYIQDLEIQLTEKCEQVNENEAKLESIIQVVKDLELKIIAKDKEIENVKDSERDWKNKYESTNRNVIGLGAAEVITLGAFSFIKWKYG